MRKGLAVLFCLLLSGAVRAQAPAAREEITPPAARDQLTLKEVRHRLALAATRAAANFRSADNIEDRLRADSSILHPQLTGLRMRIEGALEDARTDMNAGDLRSAVEAIDRAQALLDRFAKRIGGD